MKLIKIVDNGFLINMNKYWLYGKYELLLLKI